MSEIKKSSPKSTLARQIRNAKKQIELDHLNSLDPLSQSTHLKKNNINSYDDKIIMPSLSLIESQREWENYFLKKNWSPFEFQKKSWQAFLDKKSGLILSATGSGKTLAAFGGPLIALRSEGSIVLKAKDTSQSRLRILYISPLKALAIDIKKSIQHILSELKWNFEIDIRTGDTSAKDKKKQRDNLPSILFTTPESLAILMTHPHWQNKMSSIQSIIIDEWHELIGSKRGSLLELSLAKLRAVSPQAQVWAVSATLSNSEMSAKVISQKDSPILIEGNLPRSILIETLLPETSEALPWFGYRGLKKLPQVASQIDLNKTTLIFTNTRSQAEHWYLALLMLHPEWEDKIGLHHGSLAPEERERIENGIKNGNLSVVVATSTLDLGVDFPSVEKVIQIGSVKGVARATQRAGRSFHKPGEVPHFTLCPTHFLEYLEVAALRKALQENLLESRLPRHCPLDVLIQFILNSALGDGFLEEDLLREIHSTYSFHDLHEETWKWILDFLTTGGKTLQTYSEYKKLIQNDQGRYVFANPRLERFQRFNIGTIVGESPVQVRFFRGGSIGQIEESFIAQLKKGDVFSFAGKRLELVSFNNMSAYVKLSHKKETVPTIWGGRSLPLSDGISHFMRKLLSEIADSKGNFSSLPQEIKSLDHALKTQLHLSTIPHFSETLVERIKTTDGYHLFVYTWEGKLVNEGMGHIFAYQFSQLSSRTIAVSANDHGFECLSSEPFPDDEEIKKIFLTLAIPENLEFNIQHSLNFPELAKRAFREIAYISGMIQNGPPQDRKSTRHLQMSSSLLFDVFQKYDPNHPLLKEAFKEVKRSQLEFPRLKRVCEEIARGTLLFQNPKKITPFSFPLYVARISSRISTETLSARIEKLQKRYS